MVCINAFADVNSENYNELTIDEFLNLYFDFHEKYIAYKQQLKQQEEMKMNQPMQVDPSTNTQTNIPQTN